MTNNPKSSEPFVSPQDRPNVTADTPLTELRVRDLHQVLAGALHVKSIDKNLHLEKGHNLKEFKEFKEIKEKESKENIKEADAKQLKDIKDLVESGKTISELPPDPTNIGDDPIKKLQNSIDQLTSEVAQLKAKVK